MTTKEELDKKIKDIQEKCKFLCTELESLYQEAVDRGLWDFAKKIEQVQFNDYFNPIQWRGELSPLDFKIFYKILEENEASKVDVSKVLEMESKLDTIKNIINC